MPDTFTSVKPGDLISADLMNFMLTKIDEYERRLASLEAGGGPTGQVVIERLDPANQQSAGQLLSIFGRNFAFPPSGNTVILDNVPVTSFEPDSNDSILKFIIPTALTVPAAGKNVKITISNSRGTTSVLYRVLPEIPVTGQPPAITGVFSAEGTPFILVTRPIRIEGSNFAESPAQNQITLQVLSDGNPVIYPKAGQTLTIDTANSDTNRIVVDLPDIEEVVSSTQSTVVTVRVAVGAHPPASRNFQARRPAS